MLLGNDHTYVRSALTIYFHLLVISQALQEGVQRDIERQERKQRNQRELDDQLALFASLQAKQGVVSPAVANATVPKS